MRHLLHSFAGAGMALALSSCVSPQVGSPCPVRDGHPEDINACITQISNDSVPAILDKAVDILFLIDNSPSMSPKQAALARNIPLFIQKIEATGANYHVGIATSDVGTWKAPGMPWATALGTCNSYEGQDGALQRDPCTARTGITTDASAACTALCPDPSFVPTDGRSFISKVNGITNVPRKMVNGIDVGPQAAFQCMALVGDNGCGIEGQFEGAKRALDGHNPLNADFLRTSAVLAVIFITDEDDCSLQMARRAEIDPMQTDCPAGDKNASGYCFNPDFRCLARDVVCDESLNTAGHKNNCREREDTFLQPVADYVRFFSSLKAPDKLLVSGIWSPPMSKGGQLNVAYSPPGTKSYDLNRAEGMQAACFYNGGVNPGAVFSRPQVRLSKLAAQFKGSLEVSICDIDAYPAALDSIAGAIKVILGASCLSGVPKVVGGSPLCLVGDVDERDPHGAPDVAFPVCSQRCCDGFAAADRPAADDPGVQAACGAEPATCYCAVRSTAAKPVCTSSVVAGVWRKGSAPPGKVVSFKCAVAPN